MEFLQSIFGQDLSAAGLIILNLVLIESLLSVDNAAVLATMVMDLPEHQRGRALKYGIIGAYVFRGLCLLFAAFLVKIWWLKPLGGFYLLYLCFSYFKGKSTPQHDDDVLDKKENWLYQKTFGALGKFWATVVLVEIMDLAFSIDNVFAAVAFSDNLYIIWTGVFIGILAMRFVAQSFVNLMERYPFLETSAFLVIGILGVKLSLSLLCHYMPHTGFCEVMESEKSDLWLSILTVSVFVVPIITSALFGVPAKAAKVKE